MLLVVQMTWCSIGGKDRKGMNLSQASAMVLTARRGRDGGGRRCAAGCVRSLLVSLRIRVISGGSAIASRW